ncbi:hypothetical protein S7711_11330 [Stachybotrys chartarum IBT 7711]|uniref:JmjC domain-containing protein n=1 Tax=Stachybotrys chartarum (strain CBS 109288 / IBT 7711) TaxID=1280523 RepID=A0A084AQ16_STACB|nr:hypothetical protein S7711_11330 [Stachybotrys chartarum IBT 7711]KFA45822.1 hypothetical protein S40293_11335 [Stachybotrys chartarum IBT 40293]KFA76227.1 hypothetical protein S40288_11289 [Stachybotrys chartarum IBT 40288]
MKVRSQPEDIHREVVSKGFYFADDAVTGLRIEKLVQQQAPLTSANGLKFCHSNVVNHHVIRPYFMTFFDHFGLILYRSLGPLGADYCYKTSVARPNRDSIFVHLVGKGTRMIVWEGSHLHSLDYHKSDRNLWWVPSESLKEAGVNPVEVSFKQGGFIITDPRTCFSVKEGFTVTLGFGNPDVLAKWGRIELAATMEMHKIVGDMLSPRFEMNVRFVPPEYS